MYNYGYGGYGGYGYGGGRLGLVSGCIVLVLVLIMGGVIFFVSIETKAEKPEHKSSSSYSSPSNSYSPYRGSSNLESMLESVQETEKQMKEAYQRVGLNYTGDPFIDGSNMGEKLIQFEQQMKLKKPKNKVKIFAATKSFNKNMDDEQFLSGCQGFKYWCHIFDDHNEIKDAHAVVFHNADYTPDLNPPERDIVVPWVLFSQESPTNGHLRPFSNVINWTMTYRLDSDVPYPFGGFEKLETPANVTIDDIWNSKTAQKTATWLSTNCTEEATVKNVVDKIMSQGVTGELFGVCGGAVPDCQGPNADECLNNLMKTYKFYFAFETSNCHDYVTEKFYKTLETRMAVPIVLKRAIYENISAPNNSFIAVDDFTSIHELAVHINNVKDDKEKYLEYHQWRKEYRVLHQNNEKSGFCGLCTKLKNGNLELKTYGNIQDWHSKDKCDNNYLSNRL